MKDYNEDPGNDMSMTVPYPEGQPSPVRIDKVEGRPKHVITALLGVPAMFIILMFVSTIAVIFNPTMIDAALNGEVVNSEALLEDSSFMTISMLLQCLVFILVPLIAVLVVAGKKAFSMGKDGFFQKLGFPVKWDFSVAKTTVKGILLGVLLFGVLQLFGYLFAFMGQPMGSSETSETIASSSFFVMFTVAAFLVPISEEIFFRGYLLGFFVHPNNTASTRRKVIALIASSIIFGIMHFQGFSSFTDVFIIVWLTIVGFIFGLAYLKTGNLMTSIGAHIGYNGISSLSMLILM